MSVQEAQGVAQQQEQAHLLPQGPVDSSVGVDEQQAGQPSGDSGQGSRFGGFLAWLRGRRPQDAQPLPTEGDELEERGSRAQQTASVAVVVEAAEEAAAHGHGTEGAGSSAPSGSAEQASGSGSSSSSAGGDGEIEPRRSGSPRMSRLPSRGPPTCLICLEEFTQEEFVNGAALKLECNCRGDLALRHRDCVMKWVQVKGSNVCELCKAEIRNIPAPPPRPTEADLPALDEAYFNDPSHMHDFMPSSQDLVFDCIRVTWVAMIVSILFFEMSLGAALWTGLLAGAAYSVMVRLMYRQHFHAMRRLAEAQAATRREQEGSPAEPPPVVVAV